MGNSQAIDAASLVIQHPCGKVDRLHWPVTAADDIMKTNPGHYVALLITTTTLPQPLPPPETTAVVGTATSTTADNSVIRLTKLKLLKPTDTLLLGQIYRLICAQEVMKGLMAKKHERMKKNLIETARDGEADLMKEETN